MLLLIPDQILTDAGLSEREATIELACRLYDSKRLTLPAATRWTGLSRTEFEEELLRRNLPLVRVDDDYWQQELESMQQLGWK